MLLEDGGEGAAWMLQELIQGCPAKVEQPSGCLSFLAVPQQLSGRSFPPGCDGNEMPRALSPLRDRAYRRWLTAKLGVATYFLVPLTT